MCAQALELYNQACSRPDEVNLIALDPDAALGLLDFIPLQQPQEPLLQKRPRPLPGRRDRLDQPRGSPPRIVLNGSIDGGGVPEPLRPDLNTAVQPNEPGPSEPAGYDAPLPSGKPKSPG